MGCCVSSHTPSTKSQCASVASQPSRSSVSRVKASQNRAPPPVAVEEETVKEVLSETPKWKPPIVDLEHQKQTQKPIFEKTQLDREKFAPFLPGRKAQELDTASEVGNLSESMSTTTTVADTRDDEEPFRQRLHGSPENLSKNGSFTREKAVGKSPNRRHESSPGRRNTGSASGLVGLVQGRYQLSQSKIPRGRTRTDTMRREVGEQSGRRSISPATRSDNGALKTVLGRSPFARRANRSPSRRRIAQGDHGGGGISVRESEQPRTDQKWFSKNETLENPSVSFECFIFL